MHFPSEGYLSIGSGELYYRAVGARSAVPLICIHGGPGFTSYSLEPLLAVSDRFPVVVYDQAGCGRARRSGPRRDLSIDGFVSELEALRVHLQIETMHLLGHSFGALILGEYLLRFPNRVSSAIFSSASIDIPRWVADGQRLVSELPMLEKIILKECMRNGDYYSEAFLKALNCYYAKHVNGFDQMPECIQRSIEESDAVAYEQIWGPNELVVNGTIRDYSLTPRLPEINTRCLFMCGRYDEATPESHEFFASQVPQSKLHIFERSAHNTFITEEEEVRRVVVDFITGGTSL